MQYTCKEIEPLLDAYFDGELHAGELLMTKEHLGHCLDCQAKLAEIESVAQSVAGLPRLTSKGDVAEQILAKAIKMQPAQKTSVFIFQRKEFLAAAAVVLLIGLLVQFMSSPTKLAKKSADMNVPEAVATKPGTPEIFQSKPMANSSQGKTVALAGKEKQPETQSAGKKTQKGVIASGNASVKPSASMERLPTATRSTEDMLAFDYGYQPNLMEGMGIATDEDGLYALKM